MNMGDKIGSQPVGEQEGDNSISQTKHKNTKIHGIYIVQSKEVIHCECKRGAISSYLL